MPLTTLRHLRCDGWLHGCYLTATAERDRVRRSRLPTAQGGCTAGDGVRHRTIFRKLRPWGCEGMAELCELSLSAGLTDSSVVA